jgi:hypothetical protein
MLKVESFHPKLIVSDHFDDVINEIDIKIESCLAKKDLSDDEKAHLNTLREAQIEKIKEIQEINMLKLPLFDEEKYSQQWSHIIETELLSYKEKIDKLKEELITTDCLLMEDKEFKSNQCLWITPWYFNSKNLELIGYAFFLILKT